MPPHETLIRSAIDQLPAYKPGVRQDGDLIRLNLNEGPWPPFPDAIEAMTRALGELNRYPDQDYGELVSALAAMYGVERSQIHVGNGSGSLIRLLAQLILRDGDEVLMGWPAYPQYPLTAILGGAKPVQVPLRDGAMDLDFALDLIGDRTRLVFVANPHNPTGALIRRASLERWFERVPGHVATVLDEAYFEFVTEPGYPDTRAFLGLGKPLLGLRTFSKVYGLAGLRVGFGFATPELSTALHRARETFLVSGVAVAAAIASLARQDLVQERVRIMTAEREALTAACRELGLDVVPSQANFLFVDLHRDGAAVCAAMLKRGILVRPGTMHDRPTFMRVTLGLPEENQAFLAALRESLAEVPELELAAASH